MSGLASIADIARTSLEVRVVPIGDIASRADRESLRSAPRETEGLCIAIVSNRSGSAHPDSRRFGPRPYSGHRPSRLITEGREPLPLSCCQGLHQGVDSDDRKS